MSELRKLADQAVTEGVNLHYVDRARKAMYAGADEIAALEAERDTLLSVIDGMVQAGNALADQAECYMTAGCRVKKRDFKPCPACAAVEAWEAASPESNVETSPNE